jgi:hypothetical protein
MSYGTTPKGSDTIPLSSAYVENDALYAVRGQVKRTDGSSNATVAVEVAQPTGTNLHAVLDASSAVIGHVIADSGSTTAVTQATASNLNAQVVGSTASGATNSGNPVKVGGPFNTTQPTVTNGQTVDAQMTARGAQIVAPGVDGFAVTANAGTNLNTSALALETGGNLATLAGAVSSAKVQANTSQINGVAPSMGNGVSGTGVQRVTLASDSTGQVVLAAGSAIIGTITPPTSSTATLSNVAASVTSVTILASNASRKGGSVYNDSSSAMYLKQGTSASTTSFSFKIPANTLYEINASIVYTGAYTALWDTATGNARVTELS